MIDTTREQILDAIAPRAVRSVAFYLTTSGEPSPKKTAQKVEIHEYDAADRLVRITYGDLDSE